jgi:hypothetical protein
MELQRQWSSFLPNLRVAAPNPAERLSAGEEPAADYERKARQFSRDRLGRRCDRRGDRKERKQFATRRPTLFENELVPQ